MKKEFRVALKTLAIKARVYNQVRTDLFKKVITDDPGRKYRNDELLTDEEKIKLFDKWFELNKEAHRELNSYKHKRQSKAEIERLREERKQVQTPL